MTKMDSAEKKRLEWVDIAKGFAILFIVIGHSFPADLEPYGTIKFIIYSFHVPLFFILSGYTFRENNSIKEIFKAILKDIKRLLLPYAIVILVRILIGIWFYNAPASQAVKSFLCSILDVSRKNATNYASALWFLGALFLERSIYRFVGYYIKKYRVIFLAVCTVACKIVASQKFLPMYFDSIAVILLYMEIGYLLKQKEQMSAWIGLALFCGWAIMTGKYNVNLDLHGRNYDYISILNSVLGSVSFILFCQAVEDIRILKAFSFVGRHSLQFLIIHQIEWAYDLYDPSWLPIIKDTWSKTYCRLILDILILCLLVLVENCVKKLIKRCRERKQSIENVV